jgi:signal transduction histidine kinase/CheY-like chemotaxis protein/HPt (histidine-containing phosphotransfer) domain-containing protein
MESRVRDRTAELAQANKSLRSEVVERTRAEHQALNAREIAEAATRTKGEFLANMSHEIRTPMNGILGMTELALGATQDPRQKECLGMVKSSAEALLTIIDDILDFSKIEAGKLDLDPVPFRLRELLDDTLEVLALRAHEKQLELLCRVAPDVPEDLVGDPGRIRQVILNLVGNAIKFTSVGEVVVSVEVQPGGAGPGSLRFSVADTGIGVPIEKRQTIFEPFQQADGTTTRKYGGTGLGLSISARLVAMMGGRIWVEGAVGRGSVFLFDAELGLDREAAQPDSRGDASPIALVVDNNQKSREVESLQILLAEDHVINQKVAAGMLERMGHVTTIVGDGRAALQAWREGRFDLILMDVQMPEMDGFEALAAIRALEEATGDHVPIVALTAHAMSGDRENCLKAGFDEYIAKPIRSDRLREVIENLVTSAVVKGRQVVEIVLPTLEEFDEAAALDCVGGDGDLLLVIMRLFFDDCPRLLEEINDAINQSDAPTLKRLGHTVRGVASNFAMTAVVEAACRLETMGKAGELGTAQTALIELRNAIDRVRPALDVLELVGCNAHCGDRAAS